MRAEQIIEIIKATAGTASDLVNQLAWFFALGAASRWFAYSLPLLILFGVLLRIAATLKADGAQSGTIGKVIFFAWVLFGATLYSSTRGFGHILQAAFAPTIYLAIETGVLDALTTEVGGK
jgi:hypothetical protein